MRPNIEVEFVDIMYDEGGKHISRWQSLDFIFRDKISDEYIRHKIFAPETYRDRRAINDTLKHIVEFFDKDYSSIEYSYEWDRLALQIRRLLEEDIGKSFYAKFIPRKGRLILGETLPILAWEPTLSYSAIEDMYVKSGEETAPEPVVSKKKRETKQRDPTTQQEKVRRRDTTDDLPF